MRFTVLTQAEVQQSHKQVHDTAQLLKHNDLIAFDCIEIYQIELTPAYAKYCK